MSIGLYDISTLGRYLVWGVLALLSAGLCLRLGYREQLLTAVLIALVFLCFSSLRNAWIEAKLRQCLSTPSPFGYADGNKPTSFFLLVRNTTHVPVVVRAVLLRNDTGSPGVSMTYVAQSYNVWNDDPYPSGESLDELVARWGETDIDALDIDYPHFVEIPAEAGALYGSSPRRVRDHFVGYPCTACLVIFEYPTVLGGSKVICIKSNRETLTRIQSEMEYALRSDGP